MTTVTTVTPFTPPQASPEPPDFYGRGSFWRGRECVTVVMVVIQPGSNDPPHFSI